MEAAKLTPEQRKAIQKSFSARLPEILKLDPKVPITLRDKDYTLELDNSGVKYFYTSTGINLLSDFNVEDLYKPDVFAFLLQAEMLKHTPGITSEEVDSLIEFRKFMYIRDKVMDCIQLFMPESDPHTHTDGDNNTDPR